MASPLRCSRLRSDKEFSCVSGASAGVTWTWHVMCTSVSVLSALAFTHVRSIASTPPVAKVASMLSHLFVTTGG